MRNFYKNKKILVTGATGLREHGYVLGLIYLEQRFMELVLIQIKIKIYSIN